MRIEICYKDKRVSNKIQYKEFETKIDAFAFIYINQPIQIEAINIIKDKK